MRTQRWDVQIGWREFGVVTVAESELAATVACREDKCAIGKQKILAKPGPDDNPSVQYLQSIIQLLINILLHKYQVG